MVDQENGRDAAERLLHWDHEVHEAVKGQHDSGPVKLLGTLSDVGDQPQMRLLCGGVMLTGLIRADPRTLGAGLRMLLAHEIATAAKSAVKANVDRRRPRSAAGKHEERPSKGKRRDKEDTSFPSGHSAGAMAVACGFAAGYPEHRGPALLAASGVALAQIPRRAHYPTDVAAGLLIGVAAGGVANLIMRGAGIALGHLIRRV